MSVRSKLALSSLAVSVGPVGRRAWTMARPGRVGMFRAAVLGRRISCDAGCFSPSRVALLQSWHLSLALVLLAGWCVGLSLGGAVARDERASSTRYCNANAFPRPLPPAPPSSRRRPSARAGYRRRPTRRSCTSPRPTSANRSRSRYTRTASARTTARCPNLTSMSRRTSS